jgi:hypothetical protein
VLPPADRLCSRNSPSLAPKTAPCGRRRVKAHSSGFVAQFIAANRPLTSRFAIPSCLLLSPRFRRVAAPARPTQALSGPVGLRSVPDPLSNLCSIRWSSGHLARPGRGPADRSTAGAVRGAARHRPRHRPRAVCQRRAVPPRRRHQDLEPHAARAPAPARGLPAAAGWLPRPPMDPSHRRTRLRDQVDLVTLSTELLAVVDQTMEPTQVSVWLRPSPPSSSGTVRNEPRPTPWAY